MPSWYESGSEGAEEHLYMIGAGEPVKQEDLKHEDDEECESESEETSDEESDLPDPTKCGRYVVVSVTKEGITLVTNYWRNIGCWKGDCEHDA